MVSPGCTFPWPPFNAVCRSHGRFEPSPSLEPVGAANQPATTMVVGPAVPPYVATIVVRPGRIAVTRAVCGPVLTTLATAGARAPHATSPVTGAPLPSSNLAVRLTVSPTLTESRTGVTITAKLPNVALI